MISSLETAIQAINQLPHAIDSFINDNHSVYEIRHYLTRDEQDVFMEWRRQLRDTKAKIAVDRRILRLELGNLGDHKFCRDGVCELWQDWQKRNKQ